MPRTPFFKPAGIPARLLDQVVLALDEFEAIRLADLEGLYHAEAAARMRVSRATFGRILEAARRKLADAVVHGKVLRIEGGAAPCMTEPCQPAAAGPATAPPARARRP